MPTSSNEEQMQTTAELMGRVNSMSSMVRYDIGPIHDGGAAAVTQPLFLNVAEQCRIWVCVVIPVLLRVDGHLELGHAWRA